MPSRPRPSFVSHLLPGSLALCGLAIACAAQGEERRSLEPMVVTGSYNPSDTFDLPFSVDSIERRQIADGQLGINLSEVLPRVPGLVVQNRQNYAQDLQISSRGYGARSAFGIRGLKLLADGIPASTPDGQGQAATLNLDVAERIEVLRGPASTIYGSNAGGVIQMFSRDGQGAPRIGAETTVGSDGLSRNHLYTEGEGDGVGFLVDASRMDTDGYRDHSAARRDQTFAKLNFRPDADSRLALIYSSLEQNDTEDPLGQTWDAYKHDPRSVTANAELYDTRKSIDHQQAGMNYERYFGEATLQVNAYVGKRSVVQYQAIPKQIGCESNPRCQRNGAVIDFDRDFHGGTVRWLQPVRQAPGELNLTVGLDYDQSRDDRRGYQNFNGDQLGVKGKLRRDEVDTATSLDPYLQASWAIDAWTLQAGVRHSTMKMEVDDRYLSNGDASGSRRYRKNTPSFSVMYAFTPDLHGYLQRRQGLRDSDPGGDGLCAGGGERAGRLQLRPQASHQQPVRSRAEGAPVGQYAGQRGDLPDPHRGRDRRRQLPRRSHQLPERRQDPASRLRTGPGERTERALERQPGLYPAIRHLRFGFQAPAARPSARASTCRACRKAACSANWCGSPRRASAWAGKACTAARSTSRTATAKRPRRAMRYSTGAPASSSAWEPGPSTSWCAWTTCSTASTSARSSSATATGVTTKRPPAVLVRGAGVEYQF